MYKYAIFDLDGTLVDSMPMWCRLPTEYLQRKGAQPRPDLLEQIAVRTLPESVLYIKEAYALSPSRSPGNWARWPSSNIAPASPQSPMWRRHWSSCAGPEW